MTSSKGLGYYEDLKGVPYFRREDFKRFGRFVTLEGGVRVFHPDNISIGDGVYVGHDTILEGYHRNEMIIGDGTWIGAGCYFHSAGGIKIGVRVGIAPHVKILTSVHKEGSLPLSDPIIYSPLEFAEVVIEDGCDIGIGTIILPGVRIGKGVQVGAGSVVTKDVEPFMVVAGNPARVLRKRTGKE
jgi:acetyltransferase-like isoleucine patch superfamily enzyme